MMLSIEIYKKSENFMAYCPELDITSYANSSKQAVKRLKEVIRFYIQSADEIIPDNDKDLTENIDTKSYN